MRVIPVAIFVLAFASSAPAQDLDGVAIGMTKAQALQAMGPNVREVVVPEGIRLELPQPDGGVRTVLICAADRSNQVSAVSRIQPGSVDDFVHKVEELSARFGKPVIGTTPARPPSREAILAVWSQPGVTWVLRLWGPNTGIALSLAVTRPCG